MKEKNKSSTSFWGPIPEEGELDDLPPVPKELKGVEVWLPAEFRWLLADPRMSHDAIGRITRCLLLNTDLYIEPDNEGDVRHYRARINRRHEVHAVSTQDTIAHAPVANLAIVDRRPNSAGSLGKSAQASEKGCAGRRHEGVHEDHQGVAQRRNILENGDSFNGMEKREQFVDKGQWRIPFLICDMPQRRVF